MKCTVFRSALKDFTYLYLLEGQDFDDLPAPLKKVFGNPSRVMSLELTAERKLAYAGADQVMQNLAESGYYLQMPTANRCHGFVGFAGSAGLIEATTTA